MRLAYYDGATGVLASATAWLIAAMVAWQSTPGNAIGALLIGGMFIFPMSVALSKQLFNVFLTDSMRKKIFNIKLIICSVVLSFVTLAGCSVQTIKPMAGSISSARTNLHEGAWIGTIAVTGVGADDSNFKKNGKTMSDTLTFLVTVCDGKGIFWYQRDDGSFHAAAREEYFGAHSNFGNHLIYFENHDQDAQPVPGWVENQTMLLIELDSGTLRVQWSRAVSNPLLPEKDSSRDFFWHGVGALKRTATECPRELMKGIVKD